MKSRLFAAATSITALVVLLFLAPFTAQAQDTTIKTKQQAELLIPRPALQPVKSLDPNAAETLDTLDTANPHIKILLLSDYSWKYYKDADYGKDIAEFNEYWNNDQPDPYHVPLDALQDEIALWIVDSLRFAAHQGSLFKLVIAIIDTKGGTRSRPAPPSMPRLTERSEWPNISGATAISWSSAMKTALKHLRSPFQDFGR